MTVYLTRIAVSAIRNISNRSSMLSNVDFSPVKLLLHNKNDILHLSRQLTIRKYTTDTIQPVIALENASIPLKKKTVHKKAVLEDLTKKEGHYLTFAYATANSYDLKALKEALVQQKLYEPGK